MTENPLTLLVLFALIVVAVLAIKQLGSLSPTKAQELIRQGAIVVDVRSAEEFRSGSVPGAVNVPLNEIQDRIGSIVHDKNAPVLLHCLSGSRSAMARSILRRNGYTQVHNLGSLSRARRIIGAAGKS